jgi:DNA-directed RNA polymerase specialized sigma24 family protein
MLGAPVAIDGAEIQAQLGRLPPRHLAVLRAALVGFDEQDIARLLDIPVESVPTILRVAAAKLTNLLADRRGAESVPPC